jgi:hypothetical protein
MWNALERSFWWIKLKKKENLNDMHYMKDNTKIERMEIRREGADGSYLAQIMTVGGLL